MFTIKLFITFLIHIAISVEAKDCNDPLISNEKENSFAIEVPIGQTLAEIGTNNYWQLLQGEYRTMRVQLNTPHYITGVGIRVNTEKRTPCHHIETEIVLSEFEIIIDNKKVDLSNRNTVNNSFIKVSISPVFGSTVQISKVVNDSTPLVYCIQYQLYGCVDTPTNCRSLLSYDTIEPVNSDKSYTGVCMTGKCSGGLGALFDENFEKSLRWKGTSHFSLSFYKQVVINAIYIYTNSSVTIATDPMLTSVMKKGYIYLPIRKAINLFEFDVIVSGEESFDLQEIKISYYNDIAINCGNITKDIEMTTIWIAIGVGVFMFMLGLSFPIIIWFVTTRTKTWQRGKKANLAAGEQILDRTEHVYTDIQSKDSTAEVNTIHRVNMVDNVTTSTASLPNHPKERNFTLNFTESMEEEVKRRTLERQNKSKSPTDVLLEDNPLYSTSDPYEIPRNNSEILTHENPHYVTSEDMHINAANRSRITYENTEIPRADSLFNAYDKLDRNPSK